MTWDAHRDHRLIIWTVDQVSVALTARGERPDRSRVLSVSREIVRRADDVQDYTLAKRVVHEAIKQEIAKP